MKRLLALSVLFSISISTALANDFSFPTKITLEDGTTLENTKLLSQTPSDVVLHYSGGVKNIKISKLSPQIQKLLGYSQEEAATYEKEALASIEKQRIEKAALETAKKEAKALKERIKNHSYMIRGKVSNVTPDGVLVEQLIPSTDHYLGIHLSRNEERNLKLRKYSKRRPQREFGWTLVSSHPLRDTLATGDVIDIDAYRDGAQTIGQITAKKFVFLEDYTQAYSY